MLQQGEAAMREDYERAAHLATEIERFRQREDACTSAIAEATNAYEAAEARKGGVDSDELSVLQAHTELCRRCLAAREEKARREAAASASAIASESVALEAEERRIEAEEVRLRLKK